MSTLSLRDDQWAKMVQFLGHHPHVYVGQKADCRQFVEDVLWILRSGAQWQLLPETHGPWNSVYKRFARWYDRGMWDALFVYFSDDADMESIMPDSTVVHAHSCAAGAAKKRGQAAQGLGRSRGGFSSKVHILVDGLGNPLHFRLTGG